MNKIDLHIHSKASDGIKNHREIYDLFKEKGYSAISIADHNEISESLKLGEWANNKNEDNGLISLPGIEVLFPDKWHLSEILVYFRNPQNLEEFYKKNIEKKKSKLISYINSRLQEIVNTAKEHKGIICLPHPYSVKGILRKHKKEEIIHEINGIEIVNGCIRKTENKEASELYSNMTENERKKYFFLGSSDYHALDSFNYAHTEIFSEKPLSYDSLLDNLERKDTSIQFIPKGGSMPLKKLFLHHLTASINKFG